MPYDSAERTVEKSGQMSLRACAPQAIHQATVVPSGMRGRPRGQTPVRLPSQSSANGVSRMSVVASFAVRPLGVGETGFGAVEKHWRPTPAAGWCGGMGNAAVARAL